MPGTLIVGRYTDDSDPNGIHTYRLGDDGAERTGAIDLPSVSYVVRHPERPLVFAVSELDRSTVSALELRDDGTLRLLNTAPTDNAHACHLAVDPSGQFVLVAHYTSGTVTSHRISADGTLCSTIDTAEFEGSGPVTDRQDASHAHQVVFDPVEPRTPGGPIALVPDLGADAIQRLRLNERGEMTLLDPVRVRPGLGPRHLIIRDNVAVMACELTGDFWIGERSAETWESVGLVRGTRQDERTQPSAIALRGDRVFMANRDADTFVEYRLQSTELTFVDERPTDGAWPRDLAVPGEQVWIANEREGGIVAFEPFAGSWKQVAAIDVAGPACLLFLD